jgi:hypothetical protein
MKEEFARLNTQMSEEVLSFYQGRKYAMTALSDQRRLPQPYAI